MGTGLVLPLLGLQRSHLGLHINQNLSPRPTPEIVPFPFRGTNGLIPPECDSFKLLHASYSLDTLWGAKAPWREQTESPV